MWGLGGVEGCEICGELGMSGGLEKGVGLGRGRGVAVAAQEKLSGSPSQKR